ncbi:MAG: hypothetical protein PHD67_07355 [Oscillospiraceae bacterium]|nr:hypothetical protein [Oscillospiraceae bacterium]
MIRGVNKKIIEIVDIQNDYFDKAILFVREGKGDRDSGEIKQKAGEYVGAISRLRLPIRRRLAWRELLRLGAAGALGAGAALAASLLAR